MLRLGKNMVNLFKWNEENIKSNASVTRQFLVYCRCYLVSLFIHSIYTQYIITLHQTYHVFSDMSSNSISTHLCLPQYLLTLTYRKLNQVVMQSTGRYFSNNYIDIWPDENNKKHAEQYVSFCQSQSLRHWPQKRRTTSRVTWYPLVSISADHWRIDRQLS